MANATETPAKRAKLATVNVEGQTITFDFADGQTKKVDTSAFSDEIRERATMHGFEQKLRDAYAGAESPADARERMLAVVETLEKGDWAQRREGVEPDTALVIEAIQRIKRAEGVERTLEEIREKWNSYPKEDRSNYRKQPVVQKIIAEIKLERANAKPADKTAEQIAAMF